ncbi:uncharacterized protein LOC122949535 [Acropora millepora]|uniref:uncharacterized protein LOC122949535 n=1 Tax=Acropora millepora TaxID=45264 RepID=UPI001CF2AA81|nr:uncharacterized protein LOC122949535 [Acropora millepora]
MTIPKKKAIYCTTFTGKEKDEQSEDEDTDDIINAQLFFKPKSAKIAKIDISQPNHDAPGPSSSSSVTRADPDILAQSSSSSSQSHIDVPGQTCQPYDDSQTMRNHLCVMFPGLKEDVIARVVSSTLTTEEAVDTVLKIQACTAMNESDEETEELLNEECLKSNSIHDELEKLAKKLNGPRFKLRIDEDDILNDAIAYYKSPSFDPTRPLRIQFTGQPAVDTGGVKREFFTQLKEQFISGEHFSMFEGPTNRLLFKYNQQCLGAGIPKMLGTIVSHSLVHLCGGFPYLAASHYYYLATGDVERASAYTSVFDVYDVEKRDLIDKLLSAKTTQEFEELNNEEQFLSLLQDSSKTCLAIC